MMQEGRMAWIICLLMLVTAVQVDAQQKKSNILVIMTDDVGARNISAYHRGMMGGRTPNLDRIASEGALFTDYYAQRSCTTGRAAFILGQHPLRTGLLAVGLPGSALGVQKEDPTIADLLKPLGYATAQVGKNHLGDRNEILPTVHDFDEFYRNLYHLNSEEEPDYPKNAVFHEKFGPRGVPRCVPAEDGRRIRLITDRPIQLAEAREGGRSNDYDLSTLELNLSKDPSKSSGSLIIGLRVKVDKDNQLVFESYGSGPRQLVNIMQRN